MNVGDERTNLSATIQIRVTHDERRAIVAQADAAGLTISAFCRSLIHGHRVVSHIDSAMIRELRRIGGLLKSIHVDSRGAYSDATMALLGDIRTAIVRLHRDP